MSYENHQTVSITNEKFLPYGSIADITNPWGYYSMGEAPSVFHSDIVIVPNVDPAPAAFGSLRVDKHPHIMEYVKYNTYACEIMMPLDDDMIMYAGPASNDAIELDKLEAFFVPKGTLVVFRAYTWYGAPYPVHNEQGAVLICLPKRTYLNNTKKCFLEKDDFVEITL